MTKSIFKKLSLVFLYLTLLFNLSAESLVAGESTVNLDKLVSQKKGAIDHESLAYNDTLTILFIGNSFTQRDNIPGLIQQLAADGIPDLYFDWHTQIYPGRTLEQHWELGTHHIIKQASLTIPEQEELIVRLEELVAKNTDQFYKNALSRHKQLLADLKNNVKFKKWDMVVLQSWRDDIDGSNSKYLVWAPKFAEFVIAQGGEVVLYETSPGTTASIVIGRMNQFAIATPPTQSQKNVVLQKAMLIAGLAKQLNARVVPMSSVVLNCQISRPDLTLRYVSDLHPNQTGSYLGACTFYGVLFGHSPSGLPLDRVKSSASLNASNPDLDLDGKPITKIFSDTDRLDLQRIAWEGISDFSQFTKGIKEAKGNLPMEIFPNPSKGQIKLKFSNSEMDYKPFNISLISLDGKLVYSKSDNNSEGGETIIDTSYIPASFYILRVETAEDFTMTKIMLNYQ